MAAIAYNLKKYLKFEQKVDQPNWGEVSSDISARFHWVVALFFPKWVLKLSHTTIFG